MPVSPHCWFITSQLSRSLVYALCLASSLRHRKGVDDGLWLTDLSSSLVSPWPESTITSRVTIPIYVNLLPAACKKEFIHRESWWGEKCELYPRAEQFHPMFGSCVSRKMGGSERDESNFQVHCQAIVCWVVSCFRFYLWWFNTVDGLFDECNAHWNPINFKLSLMIVIFTSLNVEGFFEEFWDHLNCCVEQHTQIEHE